MPNTPKSYSYCDRSKSKVTARQRKDRRRTAPERGYDADWAKLRNIFIKRHPICQWLGCRKPAAIVDHILPISDRPDLRLSEDNLQSLCRVHHGIKTHRDLRDQRETNG